jgi:signal transduction histidine kinase
MNKLYVRIFFGGLIVIALCMFIPQMVFRALDKHDMMPPAIPLSEFTLTQLGDRLDSMRVSDLQTEIDSLAPFIGYSLSLVPLDAPEIPDEFRYDPDMKYYFRPPGPGPHREEQPAFIKLKKAKMVLMIERKPMMQKPPTGTLIIIVGLLLIIVGSAAFIMVAPVLRDLKRLETATTAFGKGDFNSRASVSSHDAVAPVASQFNVMASSIQGMIERERQLLQAVSHELRTPISRIRFSLDLLRNTAHEPDRLRRMQEIDGEVIEIDALVGELLDYNRFSSGVVTINREQHAVKPMLETVIERLRDFRADIEISVIHPTDEPCIVFADQVSFRRAIQNILLNALRYAQHKVIIKYQHREDAVWVEISDDGKGIPQAERERVLQPFVRVDDSRSKESGGVGLGLAIVSRIIQLHGGSVKIEQAEIGGAKFITCWPDNPPKN